MSRSPADLPELWGGVECTVNRVGDRYTDQVERTGHHARIDDLDRFAELGLVAIRYPVLWERIAPDRAGECDWRWSDARLERLRALGLRPIVGLVHHGSGPRYTDLLDRAFATKLGRFAAQAAARYDWVQDWTPVNEPLTTARFAALYGHWYPHAKDERLFWLALLNQVAGVRAAMKAIRAVRPDARLVQTDDFGHTYATPPLLHQARFDNERRWAGWDLLFGRVTRDHPLWERLHRLGFADRLQAAADEPCPPDVIGLNHYLTSDRFLDHRVDRYPPESRGGNGREVYADVEAVRVIDPAPAGVARAIDAAWARYRVPLALTEVHIGCTREEQLRFAAEAWDAAVAARAAGIAVEAVTAWSLLGSCGWNTLLTGPGTYEPGVFDVSDGRLRPTALAALWRGLPRDAPRHPVASAPGWWRRDVRLLYEAVAVDERPPSPPVSRAVASLLVSGADQPWRDRFAAAGTLRGLALDFCSSQETWRRIADRRRDCATARYWGVIEISRHRDHPPHDLARERALTVKMIGGTERPVPCVSLACSSDDASTMQSLVHRALDLAIDAAAGHPAPRSSTGYAADLLPTSSAGTATAIAGNRQVLAEAR